MYMYMYMYMYMSMSISISMAMYILGVQLELWEAKAPIQSNSCRWTRMSCNQSETTVCSRTKCLGLRTTTFSSAGTIFYWICSEIVSTGSI